MKIHKLRLENLNALKGAWLIDFEDKAFACGGIFAITGPTGAGKTTILDAICLALYGQTPRLDKVNKSANALMHLGSGVCSAEVELSAGDGRYHFSFAQRRAKEKADGKLQDQKREICQIHADGRREILASGQESVKQKAVEILGMDFGQFTRSAMLAQGGFAAFLQAEGFERAATLEKLTGTEIYARLGVLAFENHKQKKQRVDDLKKELDGLDLPTDEAIADLQRRQDAQSDDAAQKLAALRKIEQRQNALESYTRLLCAHQDAACRHQDALRAWENFADDKRRLERGQKFSALQSDYERYTEDTQTLTNEQQNDGDLQEKIRALGERLPKAEQEATNAANRQNALIQKQRALFALSREVDALDASIAEAKNNRALQQKNVDDDAQKLRDRQNALQKCALQIAALQRQLADRQQQENDRALFGASDGSDFAHLGEKWQNALRSCLDDTDGLARAQAEIQNLRQSLADLTQKASDAKRVKDAAADRVLRIHAQSGSDLAHFDPKDASAVAALEAFLIQSEKDAAADKQAIDACVFWLDELQKNAQKNAQDASDLAKKRAQIEQQKTRLQTLQSKLQKTQADNEQRADRYRQQALLHYRARLKDGDACPLCGSTARAHLQKEAIDDPNVDPSVLADALATEEKLRADLSYAQATLAHLIDDFAQKQQTLTKNQNAAAKQWQTLRANYAALFDEADDAKTADFALWRSRLLGKKNALSQSLQNAHERQNALRVQMRILQNAQLDEYAAQSEALRLAERLQESNDAWRLGQKNLQKNVDALAQYGSKAAQKLAPLRDFLQTFPQKAAQDALDALRDAFETARQWQQACAPITKESLPLVYERQKALAQSDAHAAAAFFCLQKTLDDLHRERQNCAQNVAACKQELALAEQQKIQTESLCAEKTNELAAAKQALAQSDALLAKRTARRFELFGDKSAQAEQDALDAQLLQNQNAQKAAQDALDALKNEIAGLKNTHETQKTRLPALIKKQQKSESRFFEHLGKLGLPTLDAYLALRVDESELAALQAKSDALQSDLARLAYEKDSLRDLLQDAVRVHPDIANWDKSALDKSAADAQNAVADAQTQLGVYQERLKNAKRAGQKGQNLNDQIAAFSKEAEIWEQMADLIGSADGKKYRNFAQSLSLDLTLACANAVLRKMNDRYELVQSDDPKQILGIDVKDKYQNDAIRPSKNLSGGETFVVSLALALGLANLSSQKTRIDSLFLDEGFGSLDEEALDIALSALAEIQASGKSVGVISHVAALKERIDTQIIVEKKSNGVSVLSGAGVYAL